VGIDLHGFFSRVPKIDIKTGNTTLLYLSRANDVPYTVGWISPCNFDFFNYRAFEKVYGKCPLFPTVRVEYFIHLGLFPPMAG
jgi:hypothetical protein